MHIMILKKIIYNNTQNKLVCYLLLIIFTQNTSVSAQFHAMQFIDYM
jgi:hypothetical protein